MSETVALAFGYLADDAVSAQETLLDLRGQILERIKETPAIGWLARTLHRGGEMCAAR